jgi:hypothetical protein
MLGPSLAELDVPVPTSSGPMGSQSAIESNGARAEEVDEIGSPAMASLTREKLRRLDLAAGAPRGEGEARDLGREGT